MQPLQFIEQYIKEISFIMFRL